jgi:chromosomal replication initiator protein
MWFDRTARLDYHGESHRLDVAVPNRVVADWIDRNFREQLCRAATEEVGQQVALTLHIDPRRFVGVADIELAAPQALHAPAAPGPQPNPNARPTHSRRPHSPTPPRDGDRQLRYSLDDFIVGPSNEIAYNAAIQLVDEGQSGKSSVNPLFIHGGVGLGKTHLLQGICRRFKELHPDARILYTTGEKFTNEYLASMGARTQDQFRQRIRRLDLLAIDDVHFLAGKEKTQQEFMHSFDEIDLSGARVVMASDNPPKQIKQFSAALVSRCVRGLVAEVRSPDTTTRVRIVRALAQRRGLTLLESVLAVLASRCQGSVREIEGTLAKLHMLANLADGRVSGGDVAAALESRVPEATPGTTPVTVGHALVNRLLDNHKEPVSKRITFERILDVCCEQLHVTRQQVLGSQRVKPIVLARSLVIYLARQLTTMSYPEISSAIHKNSHSTIIAADRKITEQLSDNATLHPIAPSHGTPGGHGTAGGDTELIPLSQLVDRIKQAILRG